MTESTHLKIWYIDITQFYLPFLHSDCICVPHTDSLPKVLSEVTPSSTHTKPFKTLRSNVMLVPEVWLLLVCVKWEEHLSLAFVICAEAFGLSSGVYHLEV